MTGGVPRHGQRGLCPRAFGAPRGIFPKKKTGALRPAERGRLG